MCKIVRRCKTEKPDDYENIPSLSNDIVECDSLDDDDKPILEYIKLNQRVYSPKPHRTCPTRDVIIGSDGTSLIFRIKDAKEACYGPSENVRLTETSFLVK